MTIENPTSWLVPTAIEVVDLHARVVTIEGAPKPGCVEGAIGAAISACLYRADTPDDADLVCLAAYALTYLARNQCFPDGNKRIAWSTMIRIFDVNGMRIRANEEDAAQLTNDVAEKRRDADSVMAWLLIPGRINSTPP